MEQTEPGAGNKLHFINLNQLQLDLGGRMKFEECDVKRGVGGRPGTFFALYFPPKFTMYFVHKLCTLLTSYYNIIIITILAYYVCFFCLLCN